MKDLKVPPDDILAAIRQRLAYCPVTGRLTWKARPERKWGAVTVRAGDEAGSPAKGGYAAVRVGGRANLASHRIAWFLHHGHWPLQYIDHVNGDRLDNRIENLRLATKSQNAANSKRQSNNTSGIKGVSYNAERSCWQAGICLNKKRKHLGRFSTKEAAAQAYASAAQRLFGEFAKLD